jgi:hypothetical protein
MPESFASPLQASAIVASTFDYATSTRGSSSDMDLLSIAFIVVLAGIGLLWIVFAERI